MSEILNILDQCLIRTTQSYEELVAFCDRDVKRNIWNRIPKKSFTQVFERKISFYATVRGSQSRAGVYETLCPDDNYACP